MSSRVTTTISWHFLHRFCWFLCYLMCLFQIWCKNMLKPTLKPCKTTLTYWGKMHQPIFFVIFLHRFCWLQCYLMWSDVIWCYRPPSAACSIFKTQSDFGGGGLARDPGPHSGPPWPPVPSAPPAPAPATTPQYARHIGGAFGPPALRAAPLTLESCRSCPWLIPKIYAKKWQKILVDASSPSMLE